MSDTPADVRVNARGCPPDSDGNGVYDYLDQCPETPANAPVDTRGCPKDSDGDGLSDWQESQRTGTDPHNPDTDSYVVKPEYYAEIEQVATFLKENPEVEGVVEGHTDKRGPAEYNQELSERRAISVIRVVEERFGVEPGRLTAVGYGGARPVADNDTAEGRARNRRIEAAFSTR